MELLCCLDLVKPCTETSLEMQFGVSQCWALLPCSLLVCQVGSNISVSQCQQLLGCAQSLQVLQVSSPAVTA